MKNTKSQPILECHHLSKSFGKNDVLQDINLTIKRGKIVGLLGRNGAGKSTLIKLMNDLLVPTSGEILIDGKPVGVNSKKVISYLPERTYLDKAMTINETLIYFTEFYSDFNIDKARELLADLNLNSNQKINEISKGMQEKLQLILVMSRDAKLYILDEPLGGIDPATRDYILDTILSNFNPDASLLISTHLISDVERILDEVIFIDHGSVKLASDADSLRKKYQKSINEIFRNMFKTEHHNS